MIKTAWCKPRIRGTLERTPSNQVRQERRDHGIQFPHALETQPEKDSRQYRKATNGTSSSSVDLCSDQAAVDQAIILVVQGFSYHSETLNLNEQCENWCKIFSQNPKKAYDLLLLLGKQLYGKKQWFQLGVLFELAYRLDFHPVGATFDRRAALSLQSDMLKYYSQACVALSEMTDKGAQDRFEEAREIREKIKTLDLASALCGVKHKSNQASYASMADNVEKAYQQIIMDIIVEHFSFLEGDELAWEFDEVGEKIPDPMRVEDLCASFKLSNPFFDYFYRAVACEFWFYFYNKQLSLEMRRLLFDTQQESYALACTYLRDPQSNKEGISYSPVWVIENFESRIAEITLYRDSPAFTDMAVTVSPHGSQNLSLKIAVQDSFDRRSINLLKDLFPILYLVFASDEMCSEWCLRLLPDNDEVIVQCLEEIASQYGSKETSFQTNFLSGLLNAIAFFLLEDPLAKREKTKQVECSQLEFYAKAYCIGTDEVILNALEEIEKEMTRLVERIEKYTGETLPSRRSTALQEWERAQAVKRNRAAIVPSAVVSLENTCSTTSKKRSRSFSFYSSAPDVEEDRALKTSPGNTMLGTGHQ